MTVDLTPKDIKAKYQKGLPNDFGHGKLFEAANGQIQESAAAVTIGSDNEIASHNHGTDERFDGTNTYRSQQTNYDMAIVHDTARHYYGNKQQVVLDDYVLTANRIYLEANETHSYLDGKVWNKGSVTTYNEGSFIKEINSHKSKLSIEKVLAKSDLAFSLLHTNTDIAFQNYNFTYGGGIDFQFGGNVNVYVGLPDTDKWLKDTSEYMGLKAKAASIGKFLTHETTLSLLGATRTDVTVGERRTASGREESYAQEVDASAQDYQLTTGTNEQMSNKIRLYADETLQIWAGKGDKSKIEIMSEGKVRVYADKESIIGSKDNLSLYSRDKDVYLVAGKGNVQVFSKYTKLGGKLTYKGDAVEFAKSGAKGKKVKEPDKNLREFATLSETDKNTIDDKLSQLEKRDKKPTDDNTTNRILKAVLALAAVAAVTGAAAGGAAAAAP